MPACNAVRLIVEQIRDAEVHEESKYDHRYTADHIYKDLGDDIAYSVFCYAHDPEDHADYAGKKETEQCQKQCPAHGS